jgi:hypothetical protein
VKKRLAALAIGVPLSGALFFSGLAAASGPVATKVTIKGPQGDFQGKIFSQKKSCLGGRAVTVFKQKGANQDPSQDKRIASDTSSRVGDHGEWSVGNTGSKNGSFYARAAKVPTVCKAGSSPTIKLVNGQPQ